MADRITSVKLLPDSGRFLTGIVTPCHCHGDRGIGKRLSMSTRQELISVVRERYAQATGAERRRILDEFVSVTRYHRKHAIRLLGGTPRACGGGIGEPRRVYREAKRSARHLLAGGMP